MILYKYSIVVQNGIISLLPFVFVHIYKCPNRLECVWRYVFFFIFGESVSVCSTKDRIYALHVIKSNEINVFDPKRKWKSLSWSAHKFNYSIWGSVSFRENKQNNNNKNSKIKTTHKRNGKQTAHQLNAFVVLKHTHSHTHTIGIIVVGFTSQQHCFHSPIH